ncbi:MAG: ABC transporter permease subunit [Planctomycetes bacterium]|nr:ABC transporter permease subunit [Planctomycetota bacterium]
MKHCLVVAHKEFKTFFRTPIGYVFLLIFLVVMGWLFFYAGRETFFQRGLADMRGFFNPVPLVFLFFIPAISMRLWAEERKLGTIELLLTLPLRTWEVVLGKFLAGLGLLVVSLLMTLPIPLVLCGMGNPDLGPILGGYAGTLLLGAVYLAIGLFASSLTENQIVALLVAITLCFLFSFWGLFSLQGILPAAMEGFFSKLSIYHHFKSIRRGVLDTRDLVYYISMILFFLYLNGLGVKLRR